MRPSGSGADRSVEPPPAGPLPMIADDDTERGFSLKRWSRRKLDAARAAPASPLAPAAGDPASPVAAPAAAAAPVAPARTPAAGRNDAPEATPVPLPPVDSLGFESDFTPYLQAKVDGTLKRQALKKLFQDPRFNVMDGLDVYIDDYSLPDPISPEAVRQLHHVRSFFAPPKTRVNAQGFVEDVPADEPAAPPAAAALPDADAAGQPPVLPSGAAADTEPAPSAGRDHDDPRTGDPAARDGEPSKR